jgi:hypothetical protein
MTSAALDKCSAALSDYLAAIDGYQAASVAADAALSVLNESRAAYDAAFQERDRELDTNECWAAYNHYKTAVASARAARADAYDAAYASVEAAGLDTYGNNDLHRALRAADAACETAEQVAELVAEQVYAQHRVTPGVQS